MQALTRRQTLLAAAGALAVGAAGRPSMAQSRPYVLIRDLYDDGPDFSQLARELDGQLIDMPGFMAPPLKPDISFFVLTAAPMATCPFCDNAADWPRDIVLVRLGREQDWQNYDRALTVTGRLRLGTEIDRETGFVSRVRLVEAAYRTEAA